MSKRVAIIGDIGGHAAPLADALMALGMDPDTLTLPEDLTVVQVGDLIHRGPDTGTVLALVAHIIEHQPQQWVQLVGNHEALYLPGAPKFGWHQRLNDAGEALLNTWWADGQMRVAAAVQTPEGDLLVTHAGLTHGLWGSLGHPTDVRDTVRALNDLPQTGPALVWATGRMLGEDTNFNAGPCWAEASPEVYTSWLLADLDGDPAPFGQVHGHTNAFDWNRSAWRPSASAMVRNRFVANRRDRHLTGVIGGQRFIGIDPDHGRQAATTWAPLVLDRARVLAR